MTPTQQLIQDVKDNLRKPQCIFKEHWYFPVDPQPDTDDLAQFPRLVLRHHNSEDTDLIWVEAGMLVYGWIIGIGRPAKEGICPNCKTKGVVEKGCPTCPGFWFENQKGRKS